MMTVVLMFSMVSVVFIEFMSKIMLFNVLTPFTSDFLLIVLSMVLEWTVRLMVILWVSCVVFFFVANFSEVV